MNNIFKEILTRSKFDKREFIIGKNPKTFASIKLDVKKTMKFISDNKIKNKRIGILVEQGPLYGISLLSVVNSNNVVVLLSNDWTKSEINKIINHCEIEYILTDNNNPKIGYKSINDIDQESFYLIRTNIKSKIKSANDEAVIIYSSGTTGDPKGVVLTKSSISSNVKSVISYLNLSSKDRSTIFTPTCYAFSLSQTLTHLYSGAALFPITTKLLFPKDILKVVREYKITGLTGPPTTFRILISSANRNKFNSVRYAQVGGTPFEEDLSKQISKTFPKAKILNVYGCSENSPRACFLYLNKKLGLSRQGYFGVGKSVKNSKVEIIKDGKTAKINEIGEIVISGKSLMKKYWKNEKLTKQKLKNGKFYTGDMGYKDADKILIIAGRIDTIINTGNEKVSPEEVENIINTNSKVIESFVYAKNDNFTGSKVCADVVLKNEISIIELQRFCRSFLSSYKVPREINFVEKIPKNLYGKIQRRKPN